MGEIILFSLIALSVPAGAYAGMRAKRSQRARWQAAAEAAGLQDVVPATGLWSKAILTARAGRHPVRIEQYAHGKYDRGTRVVIEGSSGLTLRAEKDITAVQRVIGPREIEIGDEGFDREVFVEGGDPAVLRALLDVETRARVRRFLDGLLYVTPGEGGGVAARAAIRDGSLVFEVHSELESVLCADFPRYLSGPLELARRLERPASVVERLVDSTSREPHRAMRLENLKVLARTFPRHPAAHELLAGGCEDESQEIQLQCALGLGADDEKGRATLTEIASRGWSDDPLAARAIVALGPRLPIDECTAILNHALRARSHETARACLQVLGEWGSPAVETVAKVLRVEKGDLAAAAARALGASGQAAAEAPLLKALATGDPDVRLAAVEALATAGSAGAVLPLKEAAARDGGLRRAARQTIAAIQSRIGGSPGQVSLTGGESGTLSLTDGDEVAGRLSMEKRSPP